MMRDWLQSTFDNVLDASNGTEWRVDCPFCGDTKHHMYISTESPVAFCFKCTWQGNYISLVIAVSGCTYAEALRQLESPVPNVSRFNRLANPSGLLGLTDEAVAAKPFGFRYFDINDNTSREELAVWNYLANRRRIPQAVIRKYMGWAPGTNRAWILVDDNFWQGRLIIPGDPKYISSPWPKGDAVWNVRALGGNHVTICEGVFSAIAVGSHAIALCGKTITRPQAKRIAKSKTRALTIMLDADAVEYSYELAQTLEACGFVGVLKIHRLKNGDPTDGLDGRVVTYDWEADVRNQILMAV